MLALLLKNLFKLMLFYGLNETLLLSARYIKIIVLDVNAKYSAENMRWRSSIPVEAFRIST